MAHMNCFLINGVGGSGKDTFINLCKSEGDVYSVSSVDKIKEAALLLGWNREKDDKSRKFLSDLKDLSTEYNDFPRKYMMESLKRYYYTMSPDSKINKTIFFHIREPEEIDAFKNDILSLHSRDIIVQTLLIDAKDRVPNITTNHADRDVKNYEYDNIVYNDGDIEYLKGTAHVFMEYFNNESIGSIQHHYNISRKVLWL